MKELKLQLSYHENQRKIFFESKARFKVIAKGRRFGLTRGLANYVIENMIDNVSPILWVDTIYGNIERYIERYFLPVLKDIPRNLWKYRSNRNDLKLLNAVCDFRSADKPENIEGFGYALIILNEAGIILKNRRLWEESIRPMLLDYKAKVIIGGTPKGKRIKKSNEKHLFCELYEKAIENKSPFDSPFLEKGENNSGDASTSLSMNDSTWESFNFSSYDNPLIDPLEIDELANDISPALRDQEIYGLFIDDKDFGIIKNEWWKYYLENELNTLRVYKIVQSWDTAFKKNEENDYSVCTTWKVAHNGYYLLDMWKGRVEFPELKRKVVELNDIYKPNEILVEDKASGQSLIQELQRETRLPIIKVQATNDKIARVHAITPLIEAGKVYLPKDKYWLKEFVNECEDFPNGEYDDAVDTLSQFLNSVKEDSIPNLGSIIHIPRKFTIKNKLKRIKSLRGL
ncbi:MAG: phage terminase large subunit [Melioribacteraceae bacterium]|nr:phage terminase large subunit [Melioribacteraceae bacterium]